jgi:hypothetical protein
MRAAYWSQLGNSCEAEQQRRTEQQDKQRNIEALTIAYQNLLAQEEDLLAAIGQIENVQETARRKWLQTGINNQYKQSYTDPSEANLPPLKGRLQNVRDEKDRVRRQLEQAQQQALAGSQR